MEKDHNIYKSGGRWICDGPQGRFHAKTKRDLLKLLEVGGSIEAAGLYDSAPEDPAVARAHAERIYGADDSRSMTFICPDCDTEMIRSLNDPDFLIHVESTDCAPDPWPTPTGARKGETA